jgi:hypothetical protein
MATINLEPHAVLMPKLTPREGPTLEDLLSGAWEDLIAHRTATCPICDGAMEPRYGSGPSAVGGRCGDCRTELT